MARKWKINPDGTTTDIAKWTNKGVLTLKAIFPPGPECWPKYLKRKPGVTGMLQRHYMAHTNDVIVRDIFTFFFERMMERVAAGDMFILPGKSRANITLKPMPDWAVRKLRRIGRYTEIDITKSRLKIPEFKFDLGPKHKGRDFTIYPPKKYREAAFRAVENGEATWQFIPKTYSSADVFDE